MIDTIAQIFLERRSCRAFLSDKVPLDDIEAILRIARRAPSGANLQPGRFHVFTGNALSDLTEAIGHRAQSPMDPPQYDYFPAPMPRELSARQQAAGYALYRTLGIERRDIAGRQAQFARNYRFFDAPVGIVVTIDRRMGAGCFMDLGMTLMALMAQAQNMGYATCGIGALANYGVFLHRTLDLADEEIVVCGIALGKPDPDAVVNTLRTDRADLDEYAHFYGFGKS